MLLIQCSPPPEKVRVIFTLDPGDLVFCRINGKEPKIPYSEFSVYPQIHESLSHSLNLVPLSVPRRVNSETKALEFLTAFGIYSLEQIMRTACSTAVKNQHTYQKDFVILKSHCIKLTEEIAQYFRKKHPNIKPSNIEEHLKPKSHIFMAYTYADCLLPESEQQQRRKEKYAHAVFVFEKKDAGQTQGTLLTHESYKLHFIAWCQAMYSCQQRDPMYGPPPVQIIQLAQHKAQAAITDKETAEKEKREAIKEELIAKEDCAKAKQEKAKLKKKAQQARKKLKAVQTKCNEEEEKCIKLEEKTAELTQLLEKSSQTQKKLRKKCTEVNRTLQDIQMAWTDADIDGYCTQKEALEALTQIEELNSVIEKLHAENKELSKTVNTHEACTLSLHKQVEKNQGAIGTLDNQRKILQASLNDLYKHYLQNNNYFFAEMHRLRQENEHLRAHLASLGPGFPVNFFQC